MSNYEKVFSDQDSGDLYFRDDDGDSLTISMNPETTYDSDFTPKLEAIAEEIQSMGIRGTPETPLQLSIHHVQNGKMAPEHPLTLAYVKMMKEQGSQTIEVLVYHKTYCRFLSSGADVTCRCDPVVRAKPPRRDQ